MTAPAVSITIRPAYADDDSALARLAALDSAAAPPKSPLLVAEVDGELRAALSLRDGTAIADPFVPTMDLLELLRTHAAAGRRETRRGRRRQYRLRVALG